ncbi:MAG: ATP synthase F1 subunit gamma [Marinilabiliales bacterium]|nr:MAG: ATP synthase F1 subunit gamma [Marinilabiliales bacterium]
MAGLKDIRNRIASVKSTRQITSAMKMVSAAKLKKAQDRVIQIRPYANKLTEVLAEVSSGLDKDHKGVYNVERPVESVLLVLLTSNRGLCGAFNANICKKAIHHVEEKYSDLPKESIKFLCIGKKANDFIKKQGFEIIKSGNEIFDDLTFENSVVLSKFIMDEFKNETFDKVELIYNSFKNAAVHYQIVEPFLPMEIKVEDRDHPSEYIFEPDMELIIEEMVPKSLRVQFFKVILDSNAAEHGARMTAMHQATDNATELIKHLTLMYNKARQAAITNEILEITSGANALKG